MNDVEVLIFTEYNAYKSVKKAINFTIPVHHMPLMGTGLYRSLSIIKSGYSLQCLSIDTVEEKYVEQILLELEEDNYEIFACKGSSQVDEVVQFHIVNYKSFRAVALTGIQEVSIRLSELEIPNEWVTPTQQDMTVSLERALLATNTRRNK
ncbi:hypothetical protein J4G37_48490, partial [Microvirga sp. 3-52]|nr:hypothetical protein [Microvirga sp. 3-52]